MIHTYFKILVYLTEYHFLRLYAFCFKLPVIPLAKLTSTQKHIIDSSFKDLLNHWKKILKEDPSINSFSSPIKHLKRLICVIKDLNQFLIRKSLKNSHDIEQLYLNYNCSEYFKRNYHYQTNGYFTYQSAICYDHQIELLFFGTAHIMRKVAYSTLKHFLNENAKVLEFGAGTGTSGNQFKQLFKDTTLDLLEPSKAYLDFARQSYSSKFHEIFPSFIEKFESDKKYDCIFSCFVMHEIPVNIWLQLIDKIKNSLTTDGLLLIIDSQQNNDRPEHQFALDLFAEDFYEPYFVEYRENSLEDFFTHNGFKLLNKEEVLFSKALIFKKNQ